MAKSTFAFGLPFQYEVLQVGDEQNMENIISKTKITTHEEVLTFFKKTKNVIFIFNVYELKKNKNNGQEYKIAKLDPGIKQELYDLISKRIKQLEI